MVDPFARPTRRGMLAAGYGLLVGLLLALVAEDVPWFGQLLTNLVAIVPAPIRPVDASLPVAIAIVGGFATVLALGVFFLSRRTGTGFGLLAVASIAWISFPYARLPWARLLHAPSLGPHTAPAPVWLLSGALVLLATVEIGVCARERVRQELDARGFEVEPGSLADRRTRAGARWWLAVSGLAGGAILVVFALLHPITGRATGSLDLLWVPALAGLLAGGALWLWARD